MKLVSLAMIEGTDMNPVLMIILACSIAAPPSNHTHEHCAVYHVEIASGEHTVEEAVDQFCGTIEAVYTKKGLMITRCEDITRDGPEPEIKDVPIIKARHKMEGLYRDYQTMGD